MNTIAIALFGEAERGEYSKLHYLRSVEELRDRLGEPPPESKGVHLAIQTLLQGRELLFCRVEEEGFSHQDYLYGLQTLKTLSDPSPTALCLPGVGNSEIIGASTHVCMVHKSLLIISESDLYDFLTD